MCTYNGSRFLAEQLDSFALQTRLPDELVVCDDGSSDNSVETLAEFCRRVSFPVRLIVNEKQLGSTKNFEKAVGLTQGDIVVLADQDDFWYPDKLARLEQEFVGSPDTAAAFSDADLMDGHSRLMRQRLWRSFSFSRSELELFGRGHAVKVLIKHPVVTGAAMAFRRSYFGLLIPIPAEDVHDRWMSFLLAASGRFAAIPQPLMRYRSHHSQQIGLGAVTFSERLARSRRTGTDLYSAEIAGFRRLQSRLESLRGEIPHAERAISEIEQKIAHLEHRICIRDMKSSRLSHVFREVRNRGYWNYSAGWESVAKDLFLYGQTSA
jgi:glycosyltransferase involved in cell wall biosynthesis